jgi:hypothetical protein
MLALTELEDSMADLQQLNAPTSPNLPIAPTQYSAQHYDILNNVFRLYFNQLNGFNLGVNNNLIALNTPSAGTTANRPATNLQVGQQYFDTTLGIPIWWDGTNWVDATGTTV